MEISCYEKGCDHTINRPTKRKALDSLANHRKFKHKKGIDKNE